MELRELFGSFPRLLLRDNCERRRPTDWPGTRGQTAAFGQLVEKYQDRLYNTVVHVAGNAEDAKDWSKRSSCRRSGSWSRSRAPERFTHGCTALLSTWRSLIPPPRGDAPRRTSRLGRWPAELRRGPRKRGRRPSGDWSTRTLPAGAAGDSQLAEEHRVVLVCAKWTAAVMNHRRDPRPAGGHGAKPPAPGASGASRSVEGSAGGGRVMRRAITVADGTR